MLEHSEYFIEGYDFLEEKRRAWRHRLTVEYRNAFNTLLDIKLNSSASNYLSPLRHYAKLVEISPSCDNDFLSEVGTVLSRIDQVYSSSSVIVVDSIDCVANRATQYQDVNYLLSTNLLIRKNAGLFDSLFFFGADELNLYSRLPHFQVDFLELINVAVTCPHHLVQLSCNNSTSFVNPSLGSIASGAGGL